jgi:GNAT superfamily N-acetyltransferase
MRIAPRNWPTKPKPLTKVRDMSAEMVAHVRRFNRTVTQRIGVLNEDFLASDRSLGQNRLLWEIGVDGADIRALRSRLDLDSGYVSRLLRSLQAGSDDAAAAILRPLNDGQRTRLVTAMAEVERLLTASTVEVRPCDPRDPNARHCLQTYYSELTQRFPDGYDPAVSPVADEEMTPPAGLLLVAQLHGEPVGCGALIWLPDDVGLVKRMWVDSSVRGLGLGRRLLTELEQYGRANGARLMRLETKDVLTEAIQMYRTSGYTEVAAFNDEPYADHWFEKPLDV